MPQADTTRNPPQEIRVLCVGTHPELMGACLQRVDDGMLEVE